MKWSILFFLIAFNASAADWTRINIPGAKCGDGKPYSILVQKQSSKKVLFEFMGGGVCWDYKSCFKTKSFFPWLHGYPIINSYSVMTANHSKINPLKDHSKIYFPYCTGDVFAGSHMSQYNGRTVYHYGKRNVDLALEYLRTKPFMNFSKVDDLVVYGASAGGMASLVFGKKIESFFNDNIKKTMIVDSAGMHFGKTFWNKFDSDMKADFKVAFNEASLDVDFNDGVVSKKLGPVFDTYGGWKIGFIIALRDWVMSTGFGEITPEAQKKIILSSDGIPAIAKPYPNIKVWMKDTKMHTFMLSRISASLKSLKGVSAYKFVENLYDSN